MSDGVMKIGIEAQRIFRKKKHGMDIVALEIIRELQRLDKTNKYFIFVKPDDDDEVLSPTLNFEIVRIKKAPYPYWEQVLLPQAAKKYEIDVLHCTSNTAPLRCPVPLIVTLHDIIYLEKLNLKRGSYYQIAGNVYRRWIVPIMVRKAAHIITVSNFENKTIKKRFPFLSERITTIYNAVSAHFTRVRDQTVLNSIRSRYHLPEKFALCLGNKDPKKNILGLMKSLSLLRKQNDLFTKFVMLDVDRSFLDYLSAEIDDRELLDWIIPVSYVPNDELPAIYSLATAFIYPSLRESFGIPILEAMACGTPVLTSNTSSMPEVAGDAAFLVSPSDEKALAEGIRSILGDPGMRADLSVRGMNRSLQFSWSDSAKETLQLYESFGK